MSNQTSIIEAYEITDYSPLRMTNQRQYTQKQANSQCEFPIDAIELNPLSLRALLQESIANWIGEQKNAVRVSAKPQTMAIGSARLRRELSILISYKFWQFISVCAPE